MPELSDLEFLTRFEGWAYYPWCPVKRDGVMGCVRYDRPTVHLFNIWAQKPTPIGVKDWIDYDSLAALCEAGWRVD